MHGRESTDSEVRDQTTLESAIKVSEHSSTQKRVAASVEYLAEHLHRVPVLLLACISAPGSAVLPDVSAASMWGSLFPAVWSYMLAARARGLGTVWTDLHLRHE